MKSLETFLSSSIYYITCYLPSKHMFSCNCSYFYFRCVFGAKYQTVVSEMGEKQVYWTSKWIEKHKTFQHQHLIGSKECHYLQLLNARCTVIFNKILSFSLKNHFNTYAMCLWTELLLSGWINNALNTKRTIVKKIPDNQIYIYVYCPYTEFVRGGYMEISYLVYC